jgi:hypothetical protein
LEVSSFFGRAFSASCWRRQRTSPDRSSPNHDPPAHAVMLSVDEKGQNQALDRTQAGLPLKRQRCGTMTHDYKRNGTTTLFAALNVLDGHVIGRCMQRHRHQEFIRFLSTVEAVVSASKLVHAIIANYTVHQHPRVREWLARHPLDLSLHANLGLLAERRRGLLHQAHETTAERGAFHSLVSLQAAINRFVEEANTDPDGRGPTGQLQSSCRGRWRQSCHRTGSALTT